MMQMHTLVTPGMHAALAASDSGCRVAVPSYRGNTATRAHGKSHEKGARVPADPYRLHEEVGNGGSLWPLPISSAAAQPLNARHIPQHDSWSRNGTKPLAIWVACMIAVPARQRGLVSTECEMSGKTKRRIQRSGHGCKKSTARSGVPEVPLESGGGAPAMAGLELAQER